MRLERLSGMGIQELASRGRQEASKWLDRLGAALIPASGTPWLRDELERALGRTFHIFREEAPSRFFEGPADEMAPLLLRERLPMARAQLLAAAESIGGKKFDLLGYGGLFFGDPIDWRLDPVSGRRSRFAHWSRIDLGDTLTQGDPKVIWELNRHQWLVTLGQAYRLSGDERYGEIFASTIREWTAANPDGWGINWSSSLEVAFRLISWCWAMHLFRNSRALTPDLFAEMRAAIRGHASHVERYLSQYTSPNTHLTGEALGLYYAGTQLPDLAEASRWRSIGERILVEQIERQVHDDGVYFEQSTCYQRYTIEIYLHFLILAARAHARLPESVAARTKKALDFLVTLARPDGTVPNVGDGDGGWLMPLHRRDPSDARGIFSTAAALFGNPEYAWAAGGLAPETVWLLGSAGAAAFDAAPQAPPNRPSSALFPSGGYVVMRSGWEHGDHRLIFDVGPLGPRSAAGHAHADLLSIQCDVFGEPCIVDPGTYRYAIDPLWRDVFRSTAAHSTVTLDGAGQARPDGPFSWRTLPRARVRSFVSNAALDYADAEHDAFQRLADPVVHRRRVLFLKPRFFVLVDDLEGLGRHRIDVRFQFAPLQAEKRGAWVRVIGRGGQGLLIRSFAKVPLRTEIAEGVELPPEGWVSSGYGQRRPAPVLTVGADTRLPLRIITLVVPVAGQFGLPPQVSMLEHDERRPAGLALDGGRTTVSFEEQGVVVNGTTFA